MALSGLEAARRSLIHQEAVLSRLTAVELALVAQVSPSVLQAATAAAQLQAMVLGGTFRERGRVHSTLWFEYLRLLETRSTCRSEIEIAKSELMKWRAAQEITISEGEFREWTDFNAIRGGFHGEWEEQRRDVLRFRPNSAQLREAYNNMNAVHWAIFCGPLMQVIFLHEEGACMDMDGGQEDVMDIGPHPSIGGNFIRDPAKLQYLIDNGCSLKLDRLEANFSSMDVPTAVDLVSLLILAGMPLSRQWVVNETFGLISARARVLELVEKFQGVFTNAQVSSSASSGS